MAVCLARGGHGGQGLDDEAGFVYVLGSDAPGHCRTYVGWTVDLERRLAAHNAGRGAKSTKGRVWCLLYAERLPTRREAMSREWHLKRDRALRKRLVWGAGEGNHGQE